MPSQAYELPRDPAESARLTTQHGIYKQCLGYVLHPTIAASIPSNALIADVGTGTGAWALDVASERPDCTFEGLDISDAQFPKSHPTNTSFQVLNILEPLPSALKGRYDVVHMRLLVCGLAGDEWNVAARQALELLKPGGWIQWCESDFENIEILQLESGAAREASAKLLKIFVEGLRSVGKLQGDAMNLVNTVKATGFRDSNEDVVSTDRLPEMRPQGADIAHGAAVAIMKTLAGAGKACGATVQDIEEMGKRSREELAAGKTYWRWTVHCVTGRKPA